MQERRTTAQHAIREAARIARELASTARLHQEPEEAAWFEQIAAEGEARARRVEELERRQEAGAGG